MPSEPRAAILDMNNGANGVGLRSVMHYLDNLGIKYQVFRIRENLEFPDLSFDIYISTGGPGNPIERNELWMDSFESLLHSILLFNKSNLKKKYFYLICFSFQLACAFLKVGNLSKRMRPSFGIYDVQLQRDTCFPKALEISEIIDPVILDFRGYQVTPGDNPNNCQILLMEKERPGLEMEQAILAVEFTPEIFGTQFHSEINNQFILEKYSSSNLENFEHGPVSEHKLEKLTNYLKNMPEKILSGENIFKPVVTNYFLASRSFTLVTKSSPS